MTDQTTPSPDDVLALLDRARFRAWLAGLPRERQYRPDSTCGCFFHAYLAQNGVPNPVIYINRIAYGTAKAEAYAPSGYSGSHSSYHRSLGQTFVNNPDWAERYQERLLARLRRDQGRMTAGRALKILDEILLDPEERA